MDTSWTHIGRPFVPAPCPEENPDVDPPYRLRDEIAAESRRSSIEVWAENGGGLGPEGQRDDSGRVGGEEVGR
jgi:hypothetical protein